jgi:putative ABC transport system permease protein
MDLLGSCFFMLLIACINYMNLTHSEIRAQGKRNWYPQVAGSTKRQLISQFLSESFTDSLYILCCWYQFVILFLGILYNRR